MKQVSVVGGGWSVLHVDLKKLPGVVIAVNDSAVFVPKTPDYVVSMDRKWIENRWGNIVSGQTETYVRRVACKLVKPDPSWMWFHKFENFNDNRPMSPDREVLNGANSGACAVNLAYTMAPDELYLFGFDMRLSPDGKKYWYPQYDWAKKKTSGYNSWPQAFDTYAQQFEQRGCKVFNVSPLSMITSFKKVSAQDLGIGI